MKIEQSYGSLEWLSSAELGNAAESSMSRMILAPGAVSPLHSHSNCEETAYISKGAVEAIINDVVLPLAPGEFAIAPRNTKHQFRNSSDSEAEIIFYYSSAQREYEALDH